VALRRTDEDDDNSGRPLRRLDESLSEVAAGLHLDDPRVTAAVFGGWGELVGAAVAAHARPRVLRQGVLTVEVDSPAWATQLRMLEGEVVERLAGVRSLRVVVSAKRADPG
jgi:predicted nucleic acid-binding Zn ribbon protein